MDLLWFVADWLVVERLVVLRWTHHMQRSYKNQANGTPHDAFQSSPAASVLAVLSDHNSQSQSLSTDLKVLIWTCVAEGFFVVGFVFVLFFAQSTRTVIYSLNYSTASNRWWTVTWKDFRSVSGGSVTSAWSVVSLLLPVWGVRHWRRRQRFAGLMP